MGDRFYITAYRTAGPSPLGGTENAVHGKEDGNNRRTIAEDPARGRFRIVLESLS
jgi:hypothetical protein